MLTSLCGSYLSILLPVYLPQILQLSYTIAVEDAYVFGEKKKKKKETRFGGRQTTKKPMAFCHCVHGENENVAANSDVM
jgi:hypothetical protein